MKNLYRQRIEDANGVSGTNFEHGFIHSKKGKLRVRQPLNHIQIPVLDDAYKSKIEAVKELILSEVNVKSLILLLNRIHNW
ncbi:MAG: hypothetical protein IPO70_14965 [Bacteroidetes bacterium]|nr:hypothetical protein [Bacteroidota bacterium]